MMLSTNYWQSLCSQVLQKRKSAEISDSRSKSQRFAELQLQKTEMLKSSSKFQKSNS